MFKIIIYKNVIAITILKHIIHYIQYTCIFQYKEFNVSV